MEKYYSKRLSNKMEEIREAPSVIIDAPAGYGKTSLVQEILKDEEKRVFWVRVTGEESSYQWFMQLSDILRRVDPRSSKKILALGGISRSTTHLAVQILREVNCTEKTYVVMDNMELCQNYIEPQILNAMLENTCPNLHLILITQYLGELESHIQQPDKVLFVRRADLALNREEIREYFRNKSITLSTTQAEEILTNTDGWIVGIQLYRRSSIESGEIISKRELYQIFSKIFFDQLTEEERGILIRISVFPYVTENQICFMLQQMDISSHLHEMLGRFPLIRYERSEKTYQMYSLLKNFLKDQFAMLTMEKQQKIYQRAGLWYQKHGETKEAVGYYYLAGDYESILGMNLLNLLLTQYGEVSFEEIAYEIAEKASRELKKKYPISMLRIAYVLFGYGRFQEFNQLIEELKELIEETGDMELYGEWVLISSLQKFPCVPEMTRCFEEADRLLEGRSKVADPKEPFMFGCPSMLYMFHSDVGKCEETAGEFEEMMNVYVRLTNGNGLGADVLYRGELACMRGEYQEAQILAHQAAYLGEHGRQATITYGAALLRGRIAIAQGDMEELFQSIQYMERASNMYPYLKDTAIEIYMEDTVRGMLLSMMEDTGKTASWTKLGGESKKQIVLNEMMLNHIRITDMVAKGEYVEAIGNMEAYLKLDPRICTLAAKSYMYLALSICYMAMDREEDARRNLEWAAQISFPDKMYSTFVRFADPLCVILKDSDLKEQYAEDIKTIKRLRKNARYKSDSVFNMLKEEKLPESLTKREREIALLAAKGLRNREIAKELFISERTVKAHLNTVFQKLNIDRRAKLVELLR